MGFINLNQIEKSVIFKGDFTTENELVFSFFDGISASGYDEKFEQALALGCYALTTETVGASLDKISRDLNGDLGRIRALLELRGIKEKQTQEGSTVERDLAEVIQKYVDANNWPDEIINVGEKTGEIARSKIGDIQANLVEIGARIIVESKMDGTVKTGSPSKITADPEKKTAYGQNASALVNRNAEISIFVGDVNRSDAAMVKAGRVQFFPEQPSFIVLIDQARGDYSLLEAVYGLARWLVYGWEAGEQRFEVANLITGRVKEQVERLSKSAKHLENIRTSANAILKSLDSFEEEQENLKTSIARLSDQSDELAKTPSDKALKRAIYLETKS